jgi:UDP-4-amino-4-deoxy-L-arabinose-oxoglutarate aminotransferase
VKDSVGLTSCTGALHLALLAAGVQSGDEVITTPLSYVATAHAIANAGATPVFVDVEKSTGNIDADKIEKAITKKTKAILPVHLYGLMADMKKILAIGQKHNLPVIEDAAHALESERDGIRPGTRSFGACFSFYATKSITSGEGGAFSTQRTEVAQAIRQLRSHGISSEVAQRSRVGVKHYDIDKLGWKYNMYNLQAALLLPQLKRAEKIWQRRAEIAERYAKEFGTAGISFPKTIRGAKHGHHLFTVWVDPKKRDHLIDVLQKKGIPTMINYPPIHLFSYYKNNFGYKSGDFPIAEEIGARTISLPLYAKLTDKEVAYIIEQTKIAVKSA